MCVGIQNKTEKLFRQEEYDTEYELIPFFDTSAGRIHVEDFEEEIFSERFTDFEERPILEINTPFSDDSSEERPILEINTPFSDDSSEEGSVSDDYDYDYDYNDFLDEDPFCRIDADLLDQLIKNYHESDDE